VELNWSNFVDGSEIATVVLEIVEYGGGLEAIFGPFDNPLTVQQSQHLSL
jgi:hypothetical protein